MNTETPIAAIASALAPQAIGIVRTSGEGVIELASRYFSRPEALRAAKSHTLVHGWFLDSGPGGKREPIDEVLAAVFRGPGSFTGEDMVEIYCHGGVNVLTSVLRVLAAGGFRQAEQGEFTLRAFLNGKTDLTRAEAAREITGAKTGDARKRAAERLAGSLFAEIDAVKALLVRTRAALEAEFEYPEDEEAVAAAFDPADLRQAEQRLAALAASWAAEKLYQEGTRVVLAGKTNAGKSSLFNALLKEDRAIVAESAGTTRDYLESWASFQGIPVRLFDTAGLRDAADPVEAAGVARTEELLAGAEVIVYLMDWTLGADDGDRAFLSAKHDAPVIAVWNKTDVPSTPSASHNTPCGALGNALRLSARTGTGIPGLAHAVVHALGALPAGAGGQRASLGSERQKDAADGALAAVRHALQAAGQDFPLDAVAEDIDEALVCLGEITGEVTTDDILDAVFSKFCLGK